MKTQILQQMQKAQKLVIKTVLLTSFFIYVNNGVAQENKDAYCLLNKTIQYTKKSNDSIYYLGKGRIGSKNLLEKYYNFRFNDRPFYTTVTYDSILDKIGYDTLHLEQNRIKWKAKYKVLDSLFSKEDIEQIIETNYKDAQWDSTNNFFTEKKGFSIDFCSTKVYCTNYISRPYFNKQRDYALIIHNEKGVKSTFFIFKRNREDWVLVNSVENVGW